MFWCFANFSMVFLAFDEVIFVVVTFSHWFDNNAILACKCEARLCVSCLINQTLWLLINWKFVSLPLHHFVEQTFKIVFFIRTFQVRTCFFELIILISISNLLFVLKYPYRYRVQSPDLKRFHNINFKVMWWP